MNNDKTIIFRLPKKDYDKLIRKSSKRGLKLSEYMRKLVTNGKIKNKT